MTELISGILLGLVGAVILIGIAILMAFPTMWAWNYVMPYLFGLMVKRIANRYLVVQNKWEGMDAQRGAYLKAVAMLKRLMVEYRKVIKDSQEK